MEGIHIATLIIIGANILLRSTAVTIKNAPHLIVICNSQTFSRLAYKFSDDYVRIAEIAEIQAISASIQNMSLIAENFGISTCWTITPLFCRLALSELLKVKEEILAILTLGYAAEKGRRSPRKNKFDLIRYFN